MRTVDRHSSNAPGDFYTDGNCLQCGVPEAEAPDILAPLSADNEITHFLRQPATPEEIERACRAIEVCCIDSLRYGGSDPKIIWRLGNNPVWSDKVLPGGQVRPRRNLASHWWHFRKSLRTWWYLFKGLVRR